MQRVKPLLLALLPLVLLGVAGYALHRELSHFHRGDVAVGLASIPTGHILLALALTAVNYFALTLYDVLAMGHVGRELPYARVGFTSFVGYAFGHNIGMSFLSGGSVRYRLYSAWGLTALDVAQVAAFNSLTFWVGLAAVTGTSLLVEGGGGVLPLQPGLARALGAGLWVLLLGYFTACALVRKPLRVRGLELSLPAFRRALAQLAVSCADWMLAATVLWVLLPRGAGVSLPSLVALFALAQLAGIASQVPAGLGVFETVMLSALSPHVPAAHLVGVLLVYRIIYYLVPFCVAALMLAGNELAQRRGHLRRLAKVVHTSFSPVVPWVASAGAFVAGTVLLFSGATPTVSERLAVLRHLVPLPLLEVSHFLGSLAGISLLLLARGLQRRLDGAYVLTEVLLVAGAVFSVVKGVDYEEAALPAGKPERGDGLPLRLAHAVGREQGFRRFNLGMAPFSGFEQRSLAPVWNRLGALLFRHGEHFYNFQGLRQYKEKFLPDWTPRYLASPGGLALPGVLTGVASLVSRGLGGVVAR